MRCWETEWERAGDRQPGNRFCKSDRQGPCREVKIRHLGCECFPRKLRQRAGAELRGSFSLAHAGGGHDPERSFKLCRRSDELLIRSHRVREQLRNILDAA